MRTQRSVSEHLDDFNETTGYSKQISEIREPTVQPHELATLNDVLLLTPHGFSRIEKFQMQNEEMRSKLLSNSEATCPINAVCEPFDPHSATPCLPGHAMKTDPNRPILPLIWNEGVKIMSIQERSANADRRALAAEQQRRRDERTEQEVQERKNQRRNYIIGELVTKYFPEVLDFEPGNKDENAAIFEPLEAFLYVLSTDSELIQDVQARAKQMCLDDPAGEWRINQ